ncbi:hydrogenase maturation protease [Chromatium okenii]|uniref:Hydrogenase maturation protease n=1 Tax=Chromatium okenii TaxID=61644 RepID=A0A2S7XUL5_9GAMM|nr:hydrogenase maturation protease [Chromatium okenii]MBV5308225.1 hydrogenase maturation protease [Chromatium okenii]PQJ97390.1 hydrogenase maturation protease [Chromatium okenii]
MKILVIGYGSPIRGDDALGVLVADRLEQNGVPAHVSVIARHILTAELITELLAVQRVIFLDAAVDLEPGAVRSQRLIPSVCAASSMAHFLDPRELLGWCAALYNHTPESYLITGGGASFDYADYRLSPAGETAMTAMLAEIAPLLRP